MSSKSNRFGKIIWAIIIIYFLYLLLFPGTFYMGATQGQHTGTATAIEYNSNLVWGSNIVYFKTNTASTQEDRYCVNDPEVKQQLIDISKSHSEATIYYHNNFIMWKWDCNGGSSIIYKVEKAQP